MTTVSSDCWVLLPGTLCTPDVFTPVLDQLGVAINRRHFIDVTAPNVEDYQEPLQMALTGGEIVCGFSLGAMVLAHNLDALTRAKAVVLLACNPFPDPEDNRINREAVRDRILAGGARKWVAENWSVMASGPNGALQSKVARMAEVTSHTIAAQTELAASRPGAAAQLLSTALPLVFVTGTKDLLTPPGPIRAIAKTAQRAVLETPRGLGHFALLEEPDCVAIAIKQGLKAVFSRNGHAC